MESLKDRYVKLLANKITVSIDDLTDNEFKLINESFELFSEKLEDIQILKDEIKRISVELANLKAMQDDSDNEYDD
jgi:uncharacterized Fe-S cluster-containing radical SAM superfamily protein